MLYTNEIMMFRFFLCLFILIFQLGSAKLSLFLDDNSIN
ncbi:hypothetical protein CHCC20335_4184 [Bacillus paralicheniformis]|nr:hypothetical protein CHCC20335_4184 [Bacillus paralicheniformis]